MSLERESKFVIVQPLKRLIWHYLMPQMLQYLVQLQLQQMLGLHLCVLLWCASWCCPWELHGGGREDTGMVSLQYVYGRGASGPVDWWSASGRGCMGDNPLHHSPLWYQPSQLPLHCHTYSHTCHAYNCFAHPRTCNRALWAHHQSINMLQQSVSIITCCDVSSLNRLRLITNLNVTLYLPCWKSKSPTQLRHLECYCYL